MLGRSGVGRFPSRRVVALGGAGLAVLLSLRALEGGLLYFTDFESFQIGENQWVGTDGWLGVNPEDLEGLGIEVADEVPTMAVLGWGGSGAFTTQNHWVSAEVTLGEVTQALPVAATEILPQGQGDAGSDFLSRFVVTYDWGEDVLYLDPIAELAPPTPASARPEESSISNVRMTPSS